MTSSISSSDAPRRLQRWLAVFATIAGGGLIVLFAALLLIDPYDSGRFPSAGLRGVSDNTLRTSHVSRGRDPQFDSAIFGNSTGTSVDPSVLSAGTRLRFVQLTFNHAIPREQLAVIDWFTRHHPDKGAVVLVADELWCSGDARMPARYPFPYWLYGSDGAYLGNVLNWKSFDRAVWRIQLALGRRKPIDPVGFFGYLKQDTYLASPGIPPDLTADEAAQEFVWIDRLQAMLASIGYGGSLVVVIPPVYADYLPPAGSRRADRVARCKAALVTLAATTGGGGLVDRRIDTPDVHTTDNFYDRIHYRSNLARPIEDGIVALLGRHDDASR